MKITQFNYPLTQSICCLECYLKRLQSHVDSYLTDLFVANNLDHNIAIICGWKLHCRAFYREEDLGNSIYLDNWGESSRNRDPSQVEDNFQSRVHHYPRLIFSSHQPDCAHSSLAAARGSGSHLPGYCRNVAMSGVRGSCAMLTRVTRVGCGVRRSGRTSMRIMIPPQ